MSKDLPTIHELTSDEVRLANMLKALGNPIRFRMMQYLAERFLYLPMVGWVLALAWALHGLPKPRAVPAVSVALLLCWAGLAWQRASTLVMFATELVVPWLILAPRRPQRLPEKPEGLIQRVARPGLVAAVRHLGYVQIDHHFDFGDQSVLHGPYYHGSNGRRISEHPSATAIGFVGAGDLTSARQLESLRSSGVAIRSMTDIRRDGFEVSLKAVLDDVASRSDALYVSLDIDVCDAAAAPGTGHVTIGGISSFELLQIPALLHRYPVVAFDLVEVSPRYDPAGVTAHVAARLLYELLYLREVR